MIINITMANTNKLFITTGISVLFGVYSIYNILEYLRILNNHRVRQLNSLKHQINHTNKKYNDLQIKHIELQKIYNDLSISYERINKELHILRIKLLELKENKMDDINSNNNDNLSESTSNIICDELCQFNSEIPTVNTETMNSTIDINVDDIDVEFVESLNLDYDCNTEVSCGSKKSSANNSRTRSVSITEINWVGIAKKMLFG